MSTTILGRVYNASYKKEEGKNGSVLFQLGVPNANSKTSGNSTTFIDAIAFSNQEKGIAERFNEHFGQSKQGGAHRGRPILVTGRWQERTFDRQHEQVVAINGQNYKVTFNVPTTVKQLVVDSWQFVPEFQLPEGAQAVATPVEGQPVAVAVPVGAEGATPAVAVNAGTPPAAPAPVSADITDPFA